MLPVRAAPPDAPSFPKLSDLVHIGMFEGVLRVEWVNQHPPALAFVDAQGPEARWRVRAPRPTRGMTPDSLVIERAPAGVRQADQFWHISITSTPDQTLASATRGGRAAYDTMVRLAQRADGRTGLAVTEARPTKTQTLDAKNLLDLRAQDPKLVRDAVVPWLVQLAGEDLLLPGAADVYRVFDEIDPDAETSAQVQALLPELSSPAYDRREAATAALAHLGPGGACALMRMDRSQLPPEAASRIDALLARQTRRQFDDPGVMRNDLSFLADCMEFDDARVRAAAKAQVEKITGKNVPLLPVPSQAEWSRAADVVRESVAPRPQR
jgi:hypothetical protein